MKPTYRDFLHLRTTLKELPKNFYNKLDIKEKDIFDELLHTIDSTFTPKRIPKKHEILVPDPLSGNIFQPRLLILCLNLTKILDSNRYKSKRFTFGLIRCLYKEATRVVRKTQSRSSRRLEPDQSTLELQTMTEDIEQSIKRVRAEMLQKKNQVLKNVVKVMLEQKKNCYRNYLFSIWRKESKFVCLRKKFFVQVFWKILLNKTRVSFRAICPITAKAPTLAKKFLCSTLKLVCYKVLFQVVVLIKSVKVNRSAQPSSLNLKVHEFEIWVGESVGVGSNKQSALKENLGERSHKAKADKPIGQENEDVQVEEFVYSKKPMTKMTKKKKQLLRSANQKIDKNHKWVEAFALMKWKKNYYSIQSKAQTKGNLGVLIIQLLEKIFEKMTKNRKFLFFESIKVKYSINKQSIPFKLTLATSTIENLLKKKFSILIYSAVQSIKAYKPETQTENSNTLNLSTSTLERKTYFFYKKLKTVLKKLQLKKIIMAFVSLQNFYEVKPDKQVKSKINSIFQIMRQHYFNRIYNGFQDIKEKSVVSMIKSQAFYFIIQSVIERKKFSHSKFSLCKIQAFVKGNANYLAGLIEKKIFNAMVRDSFKKIQAYSVDVDNFKYLRSVFTKSLTEKIYYKRLSSCFV